MKRGVALTTAAVVGIAAAGCSSSARKSSSGGELSGSITVYAASSLTEAFNTIKTQFIAAHPGTSVTINFGGSSDLATQITQGAAVEVFAAASGKTMQTVIDGGDASNPTNFVSNTLEIAVPPSNPAHITGLADLAKAGVKVAVCDPSVPCGDVAAKVFANAGITVHAAASEPDVKTTLAAVESGEVDAGMVYVTDVHAAGADVKGVEISADVNEHTVYPIVALKNAPNAALAQAFVAYVLSAAGKRVLTTDGFSAP